MSNEKPPLTPLEDIFLTRSQLAARWSTSGKTIQRREQEGLRAMRFGSTVRYRLSDILEFEETGY